ncbi:MULTISPECIES: hypothetical protein [Moorena]|uniref:Uncharacterized protein n=2 Tax=Moorena producens TaxID=1155739 RepID=A0A1D9G3F6_MOOP1|nr:MULTISPECIES: hypothetical protein [Moorena]NEQ15084.1 hypothetical protein [Moorena sp. SIO3E2]AOY82167.1 hypothetical protein BJP36_21930 [Moorena producens JHB]EGJ29759.1 hypothetical protein LYNGBM3L_59980 [Moorena producens 3L]NEP31085.1 hypothetical protein [Moorena sp. SIO3B2]NEP65686.1 hypothetical protein [Moorena sp. SIO3A5]
MKRARCPFHKTIQIIPLLSKAKKLSWLVTPSTENQTGKMPVPQNYSNHSIKSNGQDARSTKNKMSVPQKKGADCVGSPKIEVDSTELKSG